MVCYRPCVRSCRTFANMLLPLLLGLALLSKLLVPAGWMPSFQNGHVQLVLCSGWAPAPVAGPTAGHDSVHSAHGHDAHQASASQGGHDHRDQNQSEHDNHKPCTFAAGAMAGMAAGDTADPLQPAALLAGVLPRPFAVAIGRGLAAPPPPATGPPRLT